jgi:hypothetical protein
MVSYHGWIKIWETPYESDDDHLDEIVAQIKQYVDKVKWSNSFIDVRYANGIPLFSIQGCNNHKWGGYLDGNYNNLLEIFKLIGKIAPGSFGLLYIIDDEEEGFQNECQVFIMKKGVLEKVKDPFFSPLIPTVEDPYS